MDIKKFGLLGAGQPKAPEKVDNTSNKADNNNPSNAVGRVEKAQEAENAQVQIGENGYFDDKMPKFPEDK